MGEKLKWWGKKFLVVFKDCSFLFWVRMFGEYQHSGWDGESDFVKYKWRGVVYKIPTNDRRGPK